MFRDARRFSLIPEASIGVFDDALSSAMHAEPPPDDADRGADDAIAIPMMQRDDRIVGPEKRIIGDEPASFGIFRHRRTLAEPRATRRPLRAVGSRLVTNADRIARSTLFFVGVRGRALAKTLPGPG
jgi:hypothetical protein